MCEIYQDFSPSTNSKMMLGNMKDLALNSLLIFVSELRESISLLISQFLGTS